MLKHKSLQISVSLLLSLASGCVTVQEATTCNFFYPLTEGGGCSHLISPNTFKLSESEMLDFVSPQQARTCVPVTGMPVCADDQTTGTPVNLPARGAAIIMSDQDWGTMKTELQVACRELKSLCSYQTQQILGLK